MSQEIEKQLDSLIKSIQLQENRASNQVKSQQRVDDHGEVFTPRATVESMLTLVEDEAKRIDSRVLEPACGSGNFLVPVLQKKLKTATEKYSHSQFEREHYCLLAVMSIYGIDILKDNIEECKQNLLDTLNSATKGSDTLFRAAKNVLSINIVNGDALKMRTTENKEIVFSEWGYLGKGKYQRREFMFNSLTLSSAFNSSESLFSTLGRHEIFSPLKTYMPIKMEGLADLMKEET